MVGPSAVKQQPSQCNREQEQCNSVQVHAGAQEKEPDQRTREKGLEPEHINSSAGVKMGKKW